MSAFTILVIDDNPTDVFLLRYGLEATGSMVDVRAVPDGRAALEYCRENPVPDLIILDFLLSGETGLDILDLLQAKNVPAIPTVFLSGLMSPARSKAATSRGIVSLDKPSCLQGWLDLASGTLKPLLPPVLGTRAA